MSRHQNRDREGGGELGGATSDMVFSLGYRAFEWLARINCLPSMREGGVRCLLDYCRIDRSLLEALTVTLGRARLYRLGYLLAMYSGLRAVSNRVRHRFLPRSKVSKLDRHVIDLADAELVLRVHARVPAHEELRDRSAGMISVKLRRPGLSRLPYSLACLTSHFGCGQIEVAFYEEGERVVCYGLRDIVRANLKRIGWEALLGNRYLEGDEDVETTVLRFVLEALKEGGFEASLASPADCVRYSVDLALVAPKRAERMLRALHRRYARIARRVGQPEEGPLSRGAKRSGFAESHTEGSETYGSSLC